MQKQQVFKVKGMQRDLSMANANGEFAFEITNMRLMPTEEEAGLSLTNERGALHLEGLSYSGVVVGQCATNNSLVFFTHNAKDELPDYIYKLYEDIEIGEWKLITLFNGNLNFNYSNSLLEDQVNAIEALFNYETLDIQKVYWVDGINQLRCINIVESPENWGMVYNENTNNWEAGNNINNCYFDSVKEINSLPSVEVERVIGGNFTAGVIQYYITYFNKNSAESPIVYISPLLYIAHENRGANVNDQVPTAFKLIFTNLDITNWEYMRIYVTHRTSLDATPEASIITELNMDNSTMEFIDYGRNRTSIAPTDLYFTGGKFVKAGTMTVKDQVMFLGNLQLDDDSIINIAEIQDVFDSIRDDSKYFKTDTVKIVQNDLSQYEDSSYFYKNHLSNTSSITHYKYGEKYRFGISVLDKYGQWSNPIWIKDAFIESAPFQSSQTTLLLPCPVLKLSETIVVNDTEVSLLEYLKSKGVTNIKPLVVFPSENERKVIAQGVVCPTVYNLKDRKENGPYAQASWFMRPNAPVDLWGISGKFLGSPNEHIILKGGDGNALKTVEKLSHKSDLIPFPYTSSDVPNKTSGYYGVASTNIMNNGLYPFDYLYDDLSVSTKSTENKPSEWDAEVQLFWYDEKNKCSIVDTVWDDISYDEQQKIYSKGNWLEFRHNYALRTKGWTFGMATTKQIWEQNATDVNEINWGMTRGAELETSVFHLTPPVNRFVNRSAGESQVKLTGEQIILDNIYFCTEASPKALSTWDWVTFYVLYKYTDPNTNISYLQVINKHKAMVEAIRPNVYLNADTKGNNWAEFALKLVSSESTQLIPKGISYYIWDVRDVSIMSKEEYVKHHVKEVTINVYTEDDNIHAGGKPIRELAIGNSSYYVDNSIVTLNSPEIELHSESPVLSDTDFRIIGMVPLTASSSDISLIAENPNIDKANIGSGLYKRTFSNKNIGFHGFKGIVSSNGYLVQDDSRNTEQEENLHFYSMTPLYPWQSTGTLGSYSNTSTQYNSKDILKQKIISNLRYSASSYYFGIDSLFFASSLVSDLDHAYSDGHVIGWKPANGCFIDVFKGESKDDIIKLFDLGYSTTSLVYKGNIDTIAVCTIGNENTPFGVASYMLGEYPKTDKGNSSIGNLNPTAMINSPAAASYATSFTKISKGASIKYKSSPHFVVGFNCFNSLWGSTQKVQETLPAWAGLNEEGLSSLSSNSSVYSELNHCQLYEDNNLSSLYHQNYINVDSATFGLSSEYIPSRDSEYEWSNTYSANISFGNGNFNGHTDLLINSGSFIWQPLNTTQNVIQISNNTADCTIVVSEQKFQTPKGWSVSTYVIGGEGTGAQRSSKISAKFIIPETVIKTIKDFWTNDSLTNPELEISKDKGVIGNYSSSWEEKTLKDQQVAIKIIFKSGSLTNMNIKLLVLFNDDLELSFDNLSLLREVESSNISLPNYGWLWLGEIYRKQDPTFGGTSSYTLQNNAWELAGEASIEEVLIEEIPTYEVKWTQGDTYYQRFDTLKTYAYDDKAQNSIVDITSFMVETRINIDGRTDRNRGQESNLQMSPTNFNLMNDVYSQRDNFFTYRILDENLQARTNFPNQITWSLTKTAGATVDAWMNVTLASVLDLDGCEGQLTALRVFNNNIIAFQETGISQILFNSRVQIPTSEMVPIQIANSGKVDGQQFISRDIGCQHKYSIATSPSGLYFVDHNKKSLYRFNGQLEDLSTSKGFRGLFNSMVDTYNVCTLTYDDRNKEVMMYNPNWEWLGFSELTDAFSSFYTYPYAKLSRIKDKSIWLNENNIFFHNEGEYNDLSLYLTDEKWFHPYGITVNARRDSNIVKTFNNVEFRADTYRGWSLSDDIPFDYIAIATEYENNNAPLVYNKYRPSNLKKLLRTWRANLPRVSGSAYKKHVNQWAKVSLHKTNSSTEKTILHDLAVLYTA